MRKGTGRAYTLPGGLALGSVLSLGVTLLGSAMLAKMIETEVISERNIGYGVMGILILASYMGALISFGKIKRQRLLVCLTSGFLYFMILICITALFFGGQYSAVGVTALLVLCGSCLAAMTGIRESRGGKRSKIKIPNR